MSRRIKFNDSFNGENIVNETKEINWEAKTSINELIKIMCKSDLEKVRRKGY